MITFNYHNKAQSAKHTFLEDRLEKKSQKSWKKKLETWRKHGIGNSIPTKLSA